MDGNREGSEHSAESDRRADACHNRPSPRLLFLGFRFLQVALQALPSLVWSCLRCAISDGGLMEVFWGWVSIRRRWWGWIRWGVFCEWCRHCCRRCRVFGGAPRSQCFGYAPFCLLPPIIRSPKAFYVRSPRWCRRMRSLHGRGRARVLPISLRLIALYGDGYGRRLRCGCHICPRHNTWWILLEIRWFVPTISLSHKIVR